MRATQSWGSNNFPRAAQPSTANSLTESWSEIKIKIQTTLARKQTYPKSYVSAIKGFFIKLGFLISNVIYLPCSWGPCKLFLNNDEHIYKDITYCNLQALSTIFSKTIEHSHDLSVQEG